MLLILEVISDKMLHIANQLWLSAQVHSVRRGIFNKENASNKDFNIIQNISASQKLSEMSA